eukprot:scaffold268665_cov40-Prasinocladus_malaysianus.AAC.1
MGVSKLATTEKADIVLKTNSSQCTDFKILGSSITAHQRQPHIMQRSNTYVTLTKALTKSLVEVL